MTDIKPRFVERLNRAFREISQSDGTLYTPEDVQALTQTITASYIWRLRAGKMDNPTIAIVGALSDFFGVAPSYFLDAEPASSNSEALPLQQLVHQRVDDLDERELEVLLTVIEQIKKLRS